MNAIDRNLQNQLADHLDTTLNPKVVPLPVKEPIKSAADQRREDAALNRKRIAYFSQKAADASRKRDVTVARLEADMQAERRRHDAEMARLAGEVVAANDFASEEIEHNTAMREASEVALSRLVTE